MGGGPENREDSRLPCNLSAPQLGALPPPPRQPHEGPLPPTWAAASVKPQRALEAVLTDSPNSGSLLFLAFCEMPAMASPSTCRKQKAGKHMRGCRCVQAQNYGS